MQYTIRFACLCAAVAAIGVAAAHCTAQEDNNKTELAKLCMQQGGSPDKGWGGKFLCNKPEKK